MAKPFLVWAPEPTVDFAEIERRFAGSNRRILRVAKTLAELEGILADSDETLTREEWSLLCYGDVNDSVIAQVKRHPVHHLAPVYGMQSGARPADSEAGRKKGIFAIVEKGDFAALESSIERQEANALSRKALRELDAGFVAELGDLITEGRRLSAALDAERLAELYRLFHTIKSTAKSLQFPHLGNFMHEAEDFLSAVKSELAFRHPFVGETLTGLFAYLEDQCEQLRTGRLLELPSVDLMRKLSTFVGMAKIGWLRGWEKAGGVPATSPSISGNEDDASAVPHSPMSTRIANGQLDSLQESFKKLVQLRTRLSTFANNLKSEFGDESFPNDLLRIVEGMTVASASVMDFFISLRIVPPTRLKTFTANLAAQTAEELRKTVDFTFVAEPHLEVDSAVLEVLEGCLAHLVKNCIDHGIESTGKVRLEISKGAGDSLRVELSDDGRGIDREKLKQMVVAKGLLSEESVNRLSPENVNDLIFLDGLSTKAEVSDLSGRGVGMSAVKEQISKLGGSLRVDSESGAGTRFLITVPRIFKL